MDESQLPVLQQLALWKDKYSRLSEQYASLLNKNQEMEDRLITVVDKIERDKSLLSDEIDHLAVKLACATNTIDYMKNECARYKSDCMLAVHLLQCQPSSYTSQNLNSLPAELRQKLSPDSGAHNDGSLAGGRPGGAEKKVVQFSASAMTFPPTAVFLQSTNDDVIEDRVEKGEGNDDVRDVFLQKILMAPEYETEKLIQCTKCGYAVVKYDRCTQTIGDSSYLSNSRSAPHLFALDEEHESERPETHKRRPARTSGGDLLIDLSDDENTSMPASPTSPIEVNTNVTTTALSSCQQQHQVRFNVSPGVHYHQPHEYADLRYGKQFDGSTRETGTFSMSGRGGRCEQSRQQENAISIAISEDIK